MAAEIATVDDVRAIVREEVRAALRDLAPANPKPASMAEAARELKISERTLRRRIKAGEIPLVPTGKGRRKVVDMARMRATDVTIARLAHRALTR